MTSESTLSIACPVPIQNHPNVLLAHGGGGKLMHDLIGKLILPAFQNPLSAAQHDSSVFRVGPQRLAFTTDSYVVKPMFFPGGDLGSLAVHGTVNDLAMAGARPLYLSAAFIIEEGLPMETLSRLVASMQRAAQEASVHVVTGDTKVVDRGKGDGLFINTAGIGVLEHGLDIQPQRVAAGDVVLVNGDLGRHGMAIMSAREGLEFESRIESDSAPLWNIVSALIEAGLEIHCLRDCTRGGLTGVLNEIAESAKVRIEVEETLIPVREDVRAACELLGLDPLHVACEGRFLMFLPAAQAEKALDILNPGHEPAGGCRIGMVNGQGEPKVLLRNRIGVPRILDMPSGEQLPRIC